MFTIESSGTAAGELRGVLHLVCVRVSHTGLDQAGIL